MTVLSNEVVAPFEIPAFLYLTVREILPSETPKLFLKELLQTITSFCNTGYALHFISIIGRKGVQQSAIVL